MAKCYTGLGRIWLFAFLSLYLFIFFPSLGLVSGWAGPEKGRSTLMNEGDVITTPGGAGGTWHELTGFSQRLGVDSRSSNHSLVDSAAAK